MGTHSPRTRIRKETSLGENRESSRNPMRSNDSESGSQDRDVVRARLDTTPSEGAIMFFLRKHLPGFRSEHTSRSLSRSVFKRMTNFAKRLRNAGNAGKSKNSIDYGVAGRETLAKIVWPIDNSILKRVPLSHLVTLTAGPTLCPFN